MMDMKLYTTPISPNCRRAEATLHHLGFSDQTDFEMMNFTSGSLQTDEYLAINPNGKVPVLVHGDVVMWESLAIMHYLAGLAGDEKFMPSDNLGRADIIRWQLWESMHFNRAVGGICWETLVKAKMGLGEPDEEIVKQSLEQFHRFAKILNDHMKDRAYLLGDDMTLADFAVACTSALILHPASRVPVSDYPRVEAWLKLMEAQPAWAKTAPNWG